MRIVISVSAAFCITLALFYLMQTMIQGGGQRIEKPENYGVVDFVRLQLAPEDTKSQRFKPRPPRKPPAPPGTEPSEMKQAAVQPPAAAPQHEPMRTAMEPMQLGRPYLGPLTALISKGVVPDKPAISNTIKTPAPASPMHKEASPMARLPLGKQPLAGEAVAPISTAPGLLGEADDPTDEAVPVFRMKPRYPRKAAKSRIEGWVKVEFTITEKGTVTDAMVVDSRPRRTFDRSAVQSIRKWRFKPKVMDGRPVQRKASQIIEFKLARG